MSCTSLSPVCGHSELRCFKIRSTLQFTIPNLSSFLNIFLLLQLVDYRIEFTKWWNTEFKSIKFPSSGTVFDYFLDHDSYRKMLDNMAAQLQAGGTAEKEGGGGKKEDKLPKFEPWTKKIPSFQMPIDTPLQAVLVNTAETVRVRYFMDMLMSKGRPIMLVGTSGCGKTVMMNNKLDSLNSDDYVIANVPFNFYTTSEMLQTVHGYEYCLG